MIVVVRLKSPIKEIRVPCQDNHGDTLVISEIEPDGAALEVSDVHLNESFYIRASAADLVDMAKAILETYGDTERTRR